MHRCPTSRSCKLHGQRRAAHQARVRPAPKGGYRFDSPRAYAIPTTIRSPRSVAFSPDGAAIALGGRWGRLQVVNTTNGRALHSLGNQDELVQGLLVRFSPSGKQLLSARHRLTRVRIWDLQTGQITRELTATRYPIRDMSVTHRDRVLLATGAGVEVWNGKTGKLERIFKMRYNLPVTRVATSPSGLALAGDRAGNVLVFNPRNGNRRGRLSSPGSRLAALDLADDGSVFVVAYESGLVRLAHTTPVRRMRGFSWATRSRPVHVRLSRNKERIVVAEASGEIAHVDTERSKLLYRQQSSAGSLDDFSVSRDGRLLAAVARSGAVELWQSEDAGSRLGLPKQFTHAPEPKPKATLRLEEPVRIELETPGVNISSFSLGKRGRFLAVGGMPSQVSVYYLVIHPRKRRYPYAKRLYRRLPARPVKGGKTRQTLRVAITPNRSWLVVQGGSFYLDRYSLISGRYRPRQYREKPILRSLLPTHDSRRLITVGAGRNVLGWSLQGRLSFRFNGVRNPYWVGVSPWARTLIEVQGWDRITAFELPTGRLKWERESGPLPEFEVVGMGFTPKNHELVTFHKTGFLRYFDAETGALLRRIRIPRLTGQTGPCAIRQDAKLMACARHGALELVELPGGAPVRRIQLSPRRQHDLKVRGLAFSPRGNTLVAQTGRQKLAIFNFDRLGTVQSYTGIDAQVRFRLGLPLAAPRIQVKPGRVSKGSILDPRAPLRHNRPKPRWAPPRPRLR
ncbi:MAG: WD40 repeat domain-containing protein [bacterium]